MFVAENSKGAIVKGTVREVDAKGAVIDLGDSVEGYLRSSELTRDHVEDARTVLNVGDEVEAKFMGVDRKNRTISLSVKAKDFAEEASVVNEYKSSAGAPAATLGDLLKEQMNNQND